MKLTIDQSSGRILAVLVRASSRRLLSSPLSNRSAKSPSPSIPVLPPSTNSRFAHRGRGLWKRLHHGLDGLQLLQGALEFDDVAGISIGPFEDFDFVGARIYFRIGWQ